MWYTYMLLYLAPSFYIYINYSAFDLSLKSMNTFLKCNVLYAIVISISPLIFHTLFNDGRINIKLIKKTIVQRKESLVNNSIPINKRVLSFSYIVSLTSLIIFFTTGINKFFLLGSNLSGEEFRFLGFDDRNRVLTAILEVFRRIIYPLLSLYILAHYYIYKESIKLLSRSGLFLTFFFLCFLLISVINLDRGPILVFFSILAYNYIIIRSSANIYSNVVKIVFFVLILSIAGGLTTLLQYNITNFNSIELFSQSKMILIKRIVLDPSITSYKYCFELFSENSDKLYFRYSRLFAMISGRYIPSYGAYSIYVAPVGIVGDSWRNLGYTGIVLSGLFISAIFSYFDIAFRSLEYFIQIPTSILALILALYLLFGGLFSMGPFAIIIVITFICIYFKKHTYYYAKNNYNSNPNQK